jgi:putative ABC transport system substrate-binding protein
MAFDDPRARAQVAAFRHGLERLGWAEGRTARFDIRFATTPEQVLTHARELIARQPDVVLAGTTPPAAALQRESRTIPIVFAAVADPIGAGLVASLARPGANLTGLLSYENGLTGKWLAMLKEMEPRLERVALVANPKTSPYDYFLRAARAAAPSLGIEIISGRIESEADIKETLTSLARMTHCGLVITPDTTTIAHRNLIIAVTAAYRLPAIYFSRYWVSSGGLMSYGIDLVDQYAQAAAYVDRILRGASASQLPVQTPTKFETAINLRTAKALGLTVPGVLLVAADEVIE